MKSQGPLDKLETFGQSVWFDYIERSFFSNNKLQNMISEYALRGMTSNPSIFEKAISTSEDYDEEIKSLTENGIDVHKIYESLTQKDVQDAADVFRDLYDETKGADGYVSLEVNPHLAHDTNGTIEEARMLWKAVDRPNVMIKVPATKEGLPAIEQLISEGMNVNVTLLFSVSRYLEVVESYISGLEKRLANNKEIGHIASVASFFLSRIDVLLDPILEEHMSDESETGKQAHECHGQIAIASAKIAYKSFQEIFNNERFKKLQEKGAKVQRLLWASTGTKNKEYSDVKYVEALIGKQTVNTLPFETIKAYFDHGEPEERLTQDIKLAQQCMEYLSEFNIDIKQSTQQLEDEGVEKFIKAYDQLIETIKMKMVK